MNVNSSVMVQFPVKGSLIDSKKGSVGNRIDCAGAQALNYAKEVATEGAIIGTSAAGLYGISKYTAGKNFKWNTAVNKHINQCLNKIAEGIKDMTQFASKAIKKGKGARININTNHKDFQKLSKVKQVAAKVLEKVQNGLVSGMEKVAKSSGRQKLLVGFGVLSGAVLLHTIRKYAFKSGQIDQKYTTRGTAQKLSA